MLSLKCPSSHKSNAESKPICPCFISLRYPSNPATATDAKPQFVFKNPSIRYRRALYNPTTTHNRWKPACVTLPRLQTKPHGVTTPSLVIDWDKDLLSNRSEGSRDSKQNLSVAVPGLPGWWSEMKQGHNGLDSALDLWLVGHFKVSATLKITVFPYLRCQRFQIDMLESFLLKKNQKKILFV